MPDVKRIGAGRGARFGLARRIGNHGSSWPVYRVGENGNSHQIGVLSALFGDQWLMEFAGEEPLYSRGMKDGISDGWPWFLDELRPQGFMGRAFAHRHQRLLAAPPDLNLWGSDQFLLASFIFGDDLPGNLMVGDHPLRDPEKFPESAWPELARESVKGRPPGSSAGGERPKFSTGWEMVKFARRDDQFGRWADLLLSEHIASEVLCAHGIATAESRIVEVDGFVFLAIRRFDRADLGGRIGIHSLGAIDGAFYGEGSGSWAMMADHLYKDGFLLKTDREKVQTVWDFGRSIRNTDMHFGNLAFQPTPEGRLKVAPIYDMLPMAYAPNAAGLPEFEPVRAPIGNLEAESIAQTYWKRLSESDSLSQGFRQIAQKHVNFRRHSTHRGRF